MGLAHPAHLKRIVLLTFAGLSLSGCAWLGIGGGPDFAKAPPAAKKTGEATYGDGVVVLRLGPAPAQPRGSVLARLTKHPIITIKPGDSRLADAAPIPGYEPGWSAQTRPRAGLMHNGRLIDPTGIINPVLLQQALNRVGHETTADSLNRIGVVDYSLPANLPRFYLVSLTTGAVTAKHVAHGHAKRLCRRGGCATTGFSLQVPAVSAQPNTDATSLGLYRVLETTTGGKFPGRKVRLAGLDATNATAQRRGIIIHQNPRYFDPKRGLFGRSQGCFVFGPDDVDKVIDGLEPGSFIYAGKPATPLNTAGAGAAPGHVSAID